ncbi:hypothetical protein C5167_041477, partial [Papaver somniferum]
MHWCSPTKFFSCRSIRPKRLLHSQTKPFSVGQL